MEQWKGTKPWRDTERGLRWFSGEVIENNFRFQQFTINKYFHWSKLKNVYNRYFANNDDVNIITLTVNVLLWRLIVVYYFFHTNSSSHCASQIPYRTDDKLYNHFFLSQQWAQIPKKWCAHFSAFPVVSKRGWDEFTDAAKFVICLNELTAFG